MTGGGSRRLAADRRRRRPGDRLGRLGAADRRRLGDLLPGLHPARPRSGVGPWAEPKRLTNAEGVGLPRRRRDRRQGPRLARLAGVPPRQLRDPGVAVPEQPDAPLPEPSVVSSSPADDWGPAIAADGQGGVFVAWDTYDKGNFDVMLRDVGRAGPPVAVAASSRFEARPSLAVDKENRVWIAYEEGDEQWGKDFAHAGNVTNVGLEKNPGFALYVHRTVKLKCLDDGKLMIPAAGAEPKFGPIADRNKSVPRLGFDGDGTLWMLVRHHPLPGGRAKSGSARPWRSTARTGRRPGGWPVRPT